MRSDISHLPPSKQAELKRILKVLFEEFQDAVRLGKNEAKKNGRILKIVLFGSFARGTWVEDRASGYMSDYDILIVVDHDALTDMATYWHKAEDRFNRPGGIRRPVNIIVHTLAEVNQAISRGHYFFTDIVKEGIALYDLAGHHFAEPKPLTPAEAYDAARRYYEKLRPEMARRLESYGFERERGNADPAWLIGAAFMLHQAADRAYGCVLLTCTLYLPKTHSLRLLHSLACNIDPRFSEVWPTGQRAFKRRFELLRRAYVEARYSEHYLIAAEDLDWLLPRVQILHDLVDTVCRKHLITLAATVPAVDA